MLLAPFLYQCQHQSEAIALVESDRYLSYGDLLARAQSVAAGLQALGIQPGQPVAVHLDRGIDAVIAIFGVLLAGACYVPLDLKNPKPRLAFIIADAKVHAVLGFGDAPAWLAENLWLDINTCSNAVPKACRNFSRFPGCHSLHFRLHRSASRRGLKPWRGGVFRVMGRRLGCIAR